MLIPADRTVLTLGRRNKKTWTPTSRGLPSTKGKYMWHKPTVTICVFSAMRVLRQGRGRCSRSCHLCASPACQAPWRRKVLNGQVIPEAWLPPARNSPTPRPQNLQSCRTSLRQGRRKGAPSPSTAPVQFWLNTRSKRWTTGACRIPQPPAPGTQSGSLPLSEAREYSRVT